MRLSLPVLLAASAASTANAASAASAASTAGAAAEEPRDVGVAGEPREIGHDAEPRDIGLAEEVEITGRLVEAPATPAAAAVTTVHGDELRDQGSRSLPEALARHPEIQSIDQVGNGRQLSIDLRGFSGSEGATALVIDGIRVNDADTNVAAWEQIRIEDVESVEISAGPRGAVVGGGSLAGTVQVTRRRPPAELEADLRLRAGRFGFRDASAVAGGPAGRWRLLASGGAFEDDGFRDDAGSRERSARIAAERDFGITTLHLGLSRLDGRWRHPGALTAQEMADDPSAAPANRLDAQEAVQDLLLARLSRAGARTRLVAAAGFRDRSSDTLTTGRSLSGYGWRTTDSQQSLTLAVEGRTTFRPRKAGTLALRWGAEGARERLHPEGFATDSVDDGVISSEEQATAADLDWDRAALFAALERTWAGGLGIELSARHDRSRVGHDGKERSGGSWRGVSGKASFHDTTLRAGVGRSHEAGPATVTWRAAWEESFLAPSAIQLFAYPGFFSNPGLRPQRGRGPSLGLEVTVARLRLSLDAFETRVRDEIAYDEDARTNVNAGETRRRGASISIDWAIRDHVRLSMSHAVVDATFRGGFPEGTDVVKGARVPLVPRDRTVLVLDVGPWHGFRVRLDAQRIGAAALSNDFDGSEPGLSGRRLVSLALSQEIPGRSGLTLELCADNILDDGNPARGIESLGELYYTPPAPRSVTLGIAWRLR